MQIYTRPMKPDPDNEHYGFYTTTSIRKGSDRRYSLLAIFTEKKEASAMRKELNKTTYASIVPKKYVDKTLYAVYVRLAV